MLLTWSKGKKKKTLFGKAASHVLHLSSMNRPNRSQYEILKELAAENFLKTRIKHQLHHTDNS